MIVTTTILALGLIIGGGTAAIAWRRKVLTERAAREQAELRAGEADYHRYKAEEDRDVLLRVEELDRRSTDKPVVTKEMLEQPWVKAAREANFEKHREADRKMAGIDQKKLNERLEARSTNSFNGYDRDRPPPQPQPVIVEYDHVPDQPIVRPVIIEHVEANGDRVWEAPATWPRVDVGTSECDSTPSVSEVAEAVENQVQQELYDLSAGAQAVEETVTQEITQAAETVSNWFSSPEPEPTRHEPPAPSYDPPSPSYGGGSDYSSGSSSWSSSDSGSSGSSDSGGGCGGD